MQSARLRDVITALGMGNWKYGDLEMGIGDKLGGWHKH
jgi:hypothetical protein